MSRFLFTLILFTGIFPSLMAQGPSRSGFAADQEDKRFTRRFPCGGATILDETFSTDTLPDGWFSLDEDGFAPRAEIQPITPTGGWQFSIDFKDPDSSNLLLISPSWYENNAGPSDDYLVLPLTTLPANPCLSWYAYSQDKFFPEDYEIRVSTTTPDAQGFLANPAVISVVSEGDEFTFRSTSLAQYAGQTVYVAFRQTTQDGFILAIDDIRIADVEQSDLAMYSLNSITADPLDTLFFSGAIINLGLDTLAFDSLQLQISWQINSEPVQTIAIANPFILLPNDTLQFVHDSMWVPQNPVAYRLRVWVSGIGIDGNVENDTIARFQAIGTATGISREIVGQLNIFPNPNQGSFSVDVPESFHPETQLFLLDMQGRVIYEEQLRATRAHIQLPQLPSGIYMLVLEDINQKRATGRISIE
ncbi:MAG: choice-of-anchor J domain-containing protein [Bacteroidia bacterium]|nr:choice-of-anchor J domain-containing protein [Bacteroidia bacterium]